MVRYVLLIVACASLGSCDLGFGVRTLTDLEQAQRKWEGSRPASYVFAIERLCFCAMQGPVRVRVHGDAVVERTYVDTGQPVPTEDNEAYPSVDGLFQVLIEAYRDDAHEVRVTYDPVSGVPVDFWIDYEEMTADEELGIRVTEEVVAVGAP